jgi:hypothetical protein
MLKAAHTTSIHIGDLLAVAPFHRSDRCSVAFELSYLPIGYWLPVAPLQDYRSRFLRTGAGEGSGRPTHASGNQLIELLAVYVRLTAPFTPPCHHANYSVVGPVKHRFESMSLSGEVTPQLHRQS